MAGAPPLKGTSVGFAPRIELSSRQLVKKIEPTPACAWLSVLASGGHQEDVIRSIVASPEYFGRQGGSNAGFVISATGYGARRACG